MGGGGGGGGEGGGSGGGMGGGVPMTGVDIVMLSVPFYRVPTDFSMTLP